MKLYICDPFLKSYAFGRKKPAQCWETLTRCWFWPFRRICWRWEKHRKPRHNVSLFISLSFLVDSWCAVRYYHQPAHFLSSVYLTQKPDVCAHLRPFLLNHVDDVVCKISLNDYFILCCHGGTTREFLGEEPLSLFEFNVCESHTEWMLNNKAD